MGSRIAWFDYRVGRFFVYDEPTDEAEAWIEVLNDYFGEMCFHFAFVPGSDFTAQITPVVFDEDWRKDGHKRTISRRLRRDQKEEQESEDRPIDLDL